MIASQAAADACLLCKSRNLRAIATKTGAEIKGAWEKMGVEIPWEHWGTLKPETDVVLSQCTACSFQFFDPGLAGGGDFYQALEHPDYYCTDRPEFARTCEMARRHALRRVLDVGCGDGSFLDLAREVGLETQGLELNSAAAARARRRGHAIHQLLLHDLGREQAGGGFDLITMFQVLEHVSDPVRVMTDARTRLSEDGMISISVPSAEGVLRFCPDDPHQWPPHHVSRWTRGDLGELGRASGLILIESGGDQLHGSDLRLFLSLQRRIGRESLLSRLLLSGFMTEGLSALYRYARLKHLFRNQGASIYGYYRRA